MKSFSEMVTQEDNPCFACPDIRDLTMYDGSRWYVRLRHGFARLERDDREDPAPVSVHMGELGSNSDGIFESHEEFEKTFMHLAQRHPGMRPLLYGVDEDHGDEFNELVSVATDARDLLRRLYYSDRIDEMDAVTLRRLDEMLGRYGVERRYP
jgi:hypothetical protein